MTRKILIVEDDAATAAYVAKGLAEAGFTTEQAGDGRDGLFLASDGLFDAIVADRMLPGLDGLAMIAAIRAAGVGTPVLVLSALGTVDDRIAGLEAGADDYLPKPFAFSELLARVSALLRRSGSAAAGGSMSTSRLVVGDLEVDLIARTVTRQGRQIAIGGREFALLEYLARNAGQMVTRTMMLEKVWNYHFDPGSNVVDVHMGRLRRKLEEGMEPPILHTVRGAGYRLAVDR
jgi:two-component system OmpR family response regulator